MANENNDFDAKDEIIKEAKDVSSNDFSKFEDLATGDDDGKEEPAKGSENDDDEIDDDAEDQDDETGDETGDEDQDDETGDDGEDDSDESGDGDDDEEESDDEENDEEGPDKKPVKKKGKRSVQSRIDALTKKSKEADRAAAKSDEARIAAEARVKELEELQATTDEQAPDPTDPKYRYGEVDEDYIKDLAEHTVAKKMAVIKIKENEEAETVALEDRRKHFNAKHTDMIKSGIEKFDNFEESLEAIESGDVPLTYVMAELILESEHGAEMTDALANDPTEATRISRLSPMRQAAAIGKLEASYSSSAKPSAKKGRKSTSAPTPPQRKARGKGGKFQAAESTNDFEAFEKRMNARS